VERIYFVPSGDAGTKAHMPRRRIFERQLNLPMTQAVLDRIDAVLRRDVGEIRTTFIRTAVEHEIERREQKPPKRKKRSR
jgi:hypothetical protein